MSRNTCVLPVASGLALVPEQEPLSTVHNRFLISSLIHRFGEQDTELILRGWKANLAMPLATKDSVGIRAVASGVCDVTIANQYYVTRMKSEQSNLDMAVFWSNQKAQGVHMGLSGLAVAKSSRQPEKAKAFLEWMTGKETQKLIAELDNEFPVTPDVPDSTR